MKTNKIADFSSQLRLGSFDFSLNLNPMDLQLVKKGLLDYTLKRKKWVALFAAFGFSSYAAYRVYHLPSIARKRKRLSMLLGALISVAEVISDSAETVSVISRDLKEFLQSESDLIPNSLKQISKVTRSIEFSESVISLTQALTLGILKGYQSTARIGHGSNGPNFLDKVFDKLCTPSGSGLVSVVVGSFARNLVMAFYQDEGLNSHCDSDFNSDENSITKWVDVVSGDKCRDLIGDCIQLFVSTAVAVYLDKTMHINTYEEIFAGLTNPKHEKKVTDVLVSVCNGAIETLVKTSHEVLTSSDSESKSSSKLGIINEEEEEEEEEKDKEEEFYEEEEEAYTSEDSGWVGKVSSTLAIPSNRRLVLDVTGRVTFVTVRSFLEFLLEKVCEGIKRCVHMVYESVVDSGFGVVRYVTQKSSVLTTICLSLCLHILDGAWVMVPA